MTRQQGRIRRQPSSGLNFAGVRRYPRRRLSVEVLIQDAEGWEIPVESVDFSPVGMFVKSYFLFDVGAVHNLIFRCPDGEELFSVRAQVTRVENDCLEDEDAAPVEVLPGMAYEFVDMTQTRKSRLRRLAERV